ncbi:terminase large subunit domain-containing protein, partial [Streptomyces brasiliscabiei]|uniref:terminase large subunit domain-containing protein n=1 Tax=Streptomyces brasiliscabiei TaxID=2736302 RepID=UPI003014C8A1
SSSSIRGKSIALLYVDETAFIANDVEFFESTYPVISSGKNSRVILTSTPNGQKVYFYKKWVESTSKQNLFISKLVT